MKLDPSNLKRVGSVVRYYEDPEISPEIQVYKRECLKEGLWREVKEFLLSNGLVKIEDDVIDNSGLHEVSLKLYVYDIFNQQKMMSEQQKQESKKEFFKSVKQGQIQSLTLTQEFEGYKVGDSIMLKNGFGFVIGPFEILGFDSKNRMFLNWDCYWFAVPVERIVKVINNEEVSR